MFFTIIYNSKIWKKLSPEKRNIRSFVVGSILYVLIYLYINSKYAQDITLIQNYKHYIYYYVIIDAILITMTHFKQLKKKLTRRKYRMPPPLPMPQYPFLQYNQKKKEIKPELKPETEESIPIYEPNKELPIYKSEQ